MKTKNMFGILVTLALVLGMMAGMSTTAWAVTFYSLWVNGTQVDSDNAGHILGNNTAVYNHTTKTLTLKGANFTTGYSIDSGTAVIYYSGSDLLTIKVESDSTIDGSSLDTSHNIYGIYTNGSLQIEGAGKLSVNSGVTTANFSGAVYVKGKVTL